MKQEKRQDLNLEKLLEMQQSLLLEEESGEAPEAEEGVPAEKHVLKRMEHRREIKPLYEYCRELRDMREKLSPEEFMDLMTDRVVLLSVTLGTEVNHYSALYFEFLQEEGMLPGQGGGAEIRLNEAEGKGLSLEEAKRFMMESGGTLFSIDLTAWVERIEEESFREFLRFLYSQAEGFRYVFRIPYIEKRLVKRTASILSDIFTVDTVTIPPLRMYDIRETAASLLSEYGYTASEEAMEIFERRLQEERSDGRFYGMNTVEKVIREMVVEKLRRGRDSEEEKLIYAADIAQILAEEKTEKRDPEEELRGRIGMDEICDALKGILQDMENKKGHDPYYHINFVGNPGTGRTEAARLFGEMLKQRGMLSKGGFLEYRGEELLGTIPGETAPKVMGICRDAEGSVLFIDGLPREERENTEFETEEAESAREAFRKEAIETLMLELEQENGSFLMIFSGTEEELKRLEKQVPESKKLLPYTILFPDYTRQQLLEIFYDMAKKDGMTMDPVAEQALKEYFEKLPERVYKEPAFANGRFVRNLYERTKSNAQTRAELYEGDGHHIARADFLLAASQDAATLNQREVKKYPMGFRLRDL